MIETTTIEQSGQQTDAPEIEKAEPAKKRQNRTRKKAAETGNAVSLKGTQLALPTIPPYQTALTPIESAPLHLQPIVKDLADKLRFEESKLYFEGFDASLVNLVKQYDKQPQAVSDIDLPTLRVLYSIILDDLSGMLKTSPEELEEITRTDRYLAHGVTIYIPDFMRLLGYEANTSKDGYAFAVAKLMSYNNILGVMRGQYGDSHYPVMVFIGHNKDNNTVTFSSPYMNKLIMGIVQATIKRDSKGRALVDKRGNVINAAGYTRLVDSSIASEKNKRAAEIVCHVVVLIEQAGNNVPHIRASTLLDRCVDLKNFVDSARPADANKALKRAFSAAWKMLRTKTRLQETYKNIQLPDPEKDIPTKKTLDMVFEFRHEGKNQ